MPSLFLTGYENETIQEFLKKLTLNGIDTVIDVREIPLSRKRGFSKKELSKALQKLNIKYYHLPKLGSPSKIRHDLKEGESDYLDFFVKYRNHISHQQQSLEESLKIILENKKIIFLCFEEESDLCHRSILANEILKRNRNIKITPL